MSLTEPAMAPVNHEGIDVPLSDPSGDLLDMNQHAQALANYIRQQEKHLPFTVGIFGEWGEGKTTLVRFLCHHLTRLEKSSSQKPIRFVSFSAWPYTTSEKLWRALILEIARVLLKKEGGAARKRSEKEQEQPTASQDQTNSTGWLKTLTSFLNGDAFVLKASSPEQDEYQELVEELDNIDYGQVSKRSTSPQLDQEATMMAVINGAMTVMGTVSPLVAGLRSLFGIEPTIDMGKLVRETNQSSRQTIEALPKFQEIFGQILNKKAKEGPIYIFIDDLDRAQPDVALDIMESIRIALSEVRCVFIIAADERLIAQGLRLRYKELFAEENAAAFKSKGQEYLEKIIQLRMRVPPRTSEQAQRFISAQFPQWMPAGDIIQTVAGNNPRRLKQYCERLSFQYMIGSSPFTLGLRPAEEAAPIAPTQFETKTEIKKEEAEERTNEAKLMSDERTPVVSEAVYLAHKLRSDFSPSDLADLFLDLGRNYGGLDEDPTAKINGLVAEFSETQRLALVREAMERLKPNVFGNHDTKGTGV